MTAAVPAVFQDRDTGLQYALLLEFEGPWSARIEDQRLRSNLAVELRLCGDLETAQLRQALRRPYAQTCLMKASVPALGSLPADFPVSAGPGNPVPPALQQLLTRGIRPVTARQRAGQVVGMYIMDTEQPCVLQYICVASAYQTFGLGSRLLRHYENVVATSYPTQCSSLYLAALADSPGGPNRPVRFYQRNGYQLLDLAHATNPDVLDAAGPVTGVLSIVEDGDGVPLQSAVRVVVYSDTVVMTKQLVAGGAVPTASPAPLIGTSLTSDTPPPPPAEGPKTGRKRLDSRLLHEDVEE